MSIASPTSVGSSAKASRRVLLVGNPNTGKTSLFNRLSGLRAKTANYPGITVDLRQAQVDLPGPSPESVELVDLPGLYSLTPTSPEETVAAQALHGEGLGRPAAIVLVVDASNLARNLSLAGEVLELGLPTLVVLNMIDAVNASGLEIDVEALSISLECPVVAVSAKTSFGIQELKSNLAKLIQPTPTQLPMLIDRPSCTVGCAGCKFAARFDWSEAIANQAVKGDLQRSQTTERIDRVLTAPWIGTLCLLAVMLSVFFTIFSLAGFPMDAIEFLFGEVAGFVSAAYPTEAVPFWIWTPSVAIVASALSWAGLKLSNKPITNRRLLLMALLVVAVCCIPQTDFKSLLVDGVIGGLSGVVVFLPQICILFFFITLLEDSGYMARAAFVMERIMRFVGLPGKAFVPMLSAHACAIPGIMATRTIESWRDRLVTILVLPLLTCSARLPVYAMIAALLFGDRPIMAGLMFAAAYSLGLVAALGTAWCLKKSVLKGDAEPLVIELPPYRLPSLRNAMLTMFDRASVFLRKAGSVILLISIILWALATYPKLPSDVEAGYAEAPNSAELIAQAQMEYSLAGQAGHLLEPVFKPLGFDWQMNVAVVTSFAAREVFVSTLAVVYGMGEAEDDKRLTETLMAQTTASGEKAFSFATCVSLLVFYVLAMQCLPTQAVTRRETGTWKWAIFQFVFMSLLAYSSALVAYQSCIALNL